MSSCSYAIERQQEHITFRYTLAALQEIYHTQDHKMQASQKRFSRSAVAASCHVQFAPYSSSIIHRFPSSFPCLMLQCRGHWRWQGIAHPIIVQQRRISFMDMECILPAPWSCYPILDPHCDLILLALLKRFPTQSQVQCLVEGVSAALFESVYLIFRSSFPDVLRLLTEVMKMDFGKRVAEVRVGFR